MNSDLYREYLQMKFAYRNLLGAAILCSALAQANAGTLTDISFKSNSLSFINDTINGNGTSPLPFTSTSDLSQPFLNAADSTAGLSYGHYYAITFLGFGQHVGAGEISFKVNGGSLISQSITFPNPASASAIFANFALPGGDSVTVSSTGLSADRIRIVADGGGLIGDGSPDAFYAFNYVSAVPEPTSSLMLVGGLAMLGALVKRRRR